MKHGKFAIVDSNNRIIMTSDNYKKLESILYKFALDAIVHIVYTQDKVKL